MRPPPEDPVFIILVALLTTILSIPILLVLNYLLNGYASNYPGSRGIHDNAGEEEEIATTKKPFKISSAPSITAAEILRNSASSSAFGAELKKGLPTGITVNYRSINITSQISYAGESNHSFDLDSLLINVSPVDTSGDYRGSLPLPSHVISNLPRQHQHCQQ